MVQATPCSTLNMPCGPIVNSGSSPTRTISFPVAIEQTRSLIGSGSMWNVVPERIVSTRNEMLSLTGTAWFAERYDLEKAMPVSMFSQYGNPVYLMHTKDALLCDGNPWLWRIMPGAISQSSISRISADTG